MTPIELFNAWYKEERSITNATIPSACCLSTSGLDGFTNARFVSLKEVHNNQFIITGSLNSRKGKEIALNDKVALTFWWPETKRQVRIQGFARLIPNELADKYFSQRNRGSQIVSRICDQGQVMINKETYKKVFDAIQEKYRNEIMDRPKYWGGYSIDPVRIEFMKFQPSRMHDRILYEFKLSKWIKQQLQP